MIDPVILVDASWFLMRAYHGMPELNNSLREPVGAIFGFASMLQKLHRDYKIRRIAMIFDFGGKTFRHTLYSEYKAGRESPDNELSVQYDRILRLVSAYGLPLLKIEGVEADDVIGTLSQLFSQEDQNVLIITGDKDMAQLVNDRVHLINTLTNVTTDRKMVVKRFGVPARLIVDYLALVGDLGDNIPGIPNVGSNTAEKLLREYGSVEGIIDNLHKISGRVGDNLRACATQLPISKLLATIKCDVPLNINLNSLVTSGIDYQKLIALYKECEFKKLYQSLTVHTTMSNSLL